VERRERVEHILDELEHPLLAQPHVAEEAPIFLEHAAQLLEELVVSRVARIAPLGQLARHRLAGELRVDGAARRRRRSLRHDERDDLQAHVEVLAHRVARLFWLRLFCPERQRDALQVADARREVLRQLSDDLFEDANEGGCTVDRHELRFQVAGARTHADLDTAQQGHLL